MNTFAVCQVKLPPIFHNRNGQQDRSFRVPGEPAGFYPSNEDLSELFYVPQVQHKFHSRMLLLCCILISTCCNSQACTSSLSIDHFNPLIPRREISNTARKSVVIFLQYYQKLICFPYPLPQKLSKFQELTEKNKLHPGAEPPNYLCELPARTWIIFTVHNHLLLSNYITSFIFYALTMPK